MAKEKDLAGIAGKVHGLLKGMTPDERRKVVAAVMTLFGEGVPAVGAGGAGGETTPNTKGSAGRFTQSLASYLTEKQATTNQIRRFLATADWLRQKGTTELTSTAVTKALHTNHQKRLANSADCLNKNATKGFVEKDGKSKTFFITSEGLVSLGHEE
jgi:hypothetical protein